MLNFLKGETNNKKIFKKVRQFCNRREKVKIKLLEIIKIKRIKTEIVTVLFKNYLNYLLNDSIKSKNKK